MFRFKFSNFIWGTFLLLAAAFLLFNQFNNFMDIRIGSIIVSVLAILVIVQCIANLRFYALPIPLAVLYIIFQTPLGLPNVETKILIIASLLASIGLYIIFPRKKRNYFYYKHYKKAENNQHVCIEDSNNDNNPSVSVSFGAKNYSLNANNLETAQLSCNFGSLEVYFDKAALSQNGAAVDLNCSFGAIQLYVPRDWSVIDRVNCSLGGVDVDKNFNNSPENNKKITLTGSVSFGGIEVRCI